MTDDELFALIQRVTVLYSQFYQWDCRVSSEDRLKFLNICLSRAGADSMITPREMLRDYMTVLNILMQNPEAKFDDVVGSQVTLKTANDIDDDTDLPISAQAPAKAEAGKHKFSANDIEF